MNKIVLVDDDALVLRVHALMLKALGYVPFTFESSEGALGYLRRYGDHVGMVITDYQMPNMNGLELIVQIRKFNGGMPAVILTADSSEVDRGKAEKCNAKVIDKPVRMHVLMDHIHSYKMNKSLLISNSLS